MAKSFEGFEFETDDLGHTNIERKICHHYGLGWVDSSSFMKLAESLNQELSIFASNGYIECAADVYKKNNSDKFTVSVYCVSITRNKR